MIPKCWPVQRLQENKQGGIYMFFKASKVAVLPQ